MLSALEVQSRDVLNFAIKAETEASTYGFPMYRQFREKVSEFESFATLVETRISNLEMGRDERLERQFHQLDILIFKVLIKATHKILAAISAAPDQPLGVRDAYEAELRSLNHHRERLKDPRYAKAVDEDTLRRIDETEKILLEVMERSPGLPEFGKDVVPAADARPPSETGED
ncbi:MAG: hypothetical protein NXI16_10135 [Alphaproteobacteria bacterium]|nr:hypothetical protein [Alphaproteobacteria bacterium]